MNSALLLLGTSGSRKSNLAFALTRLPPDRRRDALVFYHFCRTIDDIADDPARPAADKAACLAEWKIALTSGNGLPSALETVIATRHLDRQLLVEIILGVEQDICPQDFPTCDALRRYCWRVACAVGLTSIEIFGCTDPRSKVYAEELGYALQWTNILRDVGEDARLGRVYLPVETLRHFSLTPEQIRTGQPGPGFQEFMRFESRRAEEHFARARANLAPADRRALAPARTMGAIYREILRRMEADGYRVFEKRYRVPLWRKMGLLAWPD